MPKNIVLTLNNSGPDIGPYGIILYDSSNNPTVLPNTITKAQLTAGYFLTVPDPIVKVTVKSQSNNNCDEVELTIPTTKCPCRNFTFTSGSTPSTFRFYECGRITQSSLSIRNITVTRCIDATKPFSKVIGSGSFLDTNNCCVPPSTTTSSTTSTTSTTTSTTRLPTTTTTTTTCQQCYRVRNNSSNSQAISYDNCSGFTFTENLSGNTTYYYCAKINSIVVNTLFVSVTPLSTSCTSNGSCIPPTTTTTTTTINPSPSARTITIQPFNADMSIVIEAGRTSGSTNPDLLTFTGIVRRYSDTNCTIVNNQYNFNLTLPANALYNSANLTAWNPSPRMKIESLSVNGNVITQNPQNITVNGNVYTIAGFNVCKQIN